MSDYDYNKDPQGAESFFELKKDKRTKRFLEAIKDLSHPKILEIGMGQGRFLKKIARFRPDAEFFGIDISRSAIDLVKNDSHLNGTFLIGDAEKIPFPNNSFDVVVIMDVLEHVPNPEKVIAEVNRVLKHDGIFHFFVPCEGQQFTLDRFLKKTNFLGFGNFTKVHFGHIQYFSQSDIKKLASPYFLELSITYSSHWISQMLNFFTLYLPKKLIPLFGEDIQRKTRDAYKSEIKDESINDIIIIFKKLWLLFTFPISIVCEIEAALLKNLNLTAQGLHFTGQKNKPNLN